MQEEREREKESVRLLNQSGQSRPSFREAVRMAAEQIEIECFGQQDKQFAREICYTIAEVYISRDDWAFMVEHEPVDAYMAREVFREIRNEHVATVIRNFRDVSQKISNKRAYLRTALYNSVFELEADVQNAVSRILKGEI